MCSKTKKKRDDAPDCELCIERGEEYGWPMAVLGCDGWSLHWDCSCGRLQEETSIPWPFGDNAVSIDEMKASGYEVIWT
jgi:hypothetical protein